MLQLYNASQGPSSIILKHAFQLSEEFLVDVKMASLEKDFLNGVTAYQHVEYSPWLP